MVDEGCPVPPKMMPADPVASGPAASGCSTGRGAAIWLAALVLLKRRRLQ
ncbi:MAG: hypothetical protein QM723_20980 [Myxococcaceae bacterium]